MTNLILWTVLLVSFHISNLPPLRLSEHKAAMVVHVILLVVIGGALGWGWGSALVDFWVN